jgi:putative acyl-CoA dehydrogenase
VNALDVLRAIEREPESLEAFFNEVRAAEGMNPRYDAALRTFEREVSDRSDIEARARRVVEMMAILLEASLLMRHGDPGTADVFVAARLGEAGHQFGTLRPTNLLKRIVERALPTV